MFEEEVVAWTGNVDSREEGFSFATDSALVEFGDGSSDGEVWSALVEFAVDGDFLFLVLTFPLDVITDLETQDWFWKIE